jgi:hypothetical protein
VYKHLTLFQSRAGYGKVTLACDHVWYCIFFVYWFNYKILNCILHVIFILNNNETKEKEINFFDWTNQKSLESNRFFYNKNFLSLVFIQMTLLIKKQKKANDNKTCKKQRTHMKKKSKRSFFYMNYARKEKNENTGWKELYDNIV